MLKNLPLNNLIDVDKSYFENRFYFIKDKVILENIEIYIRYITFLLTIISEYDVSGKVLFSINKNIIIYCAQVTEACCLYVIKELIRNKIFSGYDLLGSEWKSISEKYTRTTSLNRLVKEKEEVRLKTSIEKFQTKEFSNGILFTQVKNASKQAGFRDDIVELINEMKTQRNKIHIGVQTAIDDIYPKEVVYKSINSLSRIIDECIFILNKNLLI